MRLYLDSFDLSSWDRLLPSGLFYGITTNPILAARAGLHYGQINWHEVIGKAAGHHMRELHIQLPDCSDAALDFAHELSVAAADTDMDIVIKIPLTEAGIALVQHVRAMGLPVLMTACYHAKQIFVAQAVGAAYIAPYYGRMVEAGIDARTHLRQMQAVAGSADTPCQLLIASVRSAEQMTELAEDGHSLFTIAPQIADSLLFDQHTEAAYSEFLDAAKA